MLGSLRCRSPASELLDERAYRDLDELRGNLRDMARYDRWLGVSALALQLATADLPLTSAAHTGLDVGCGSGGFIAHARRTSSTVCWLGLDVSQDVLRVARRDHPELNGICAQGTRLPFADAGVDVVTCIHLLHHLAPPNAIALLREFARVARLRVVCLDLTRSAGTLIGAWLLTRLTSRNRLTRADGVQSARRAYTPEEAADLARRAGWSDFEVRTHGPFRYSLTLTRSFA
ncbi:MAG: methyltransferase domain-containing protein [Anaerolineae bacterium]|nr:methyltransferase domain-containing protein [Candidatus Roseilinea sp.]MDW8451790.1 methyltransferase domain-containing protein [Anaerolineae bacterium]